MNPTRETLLCRLKDTGDQSAWQEFFELYAPLIYRYARSRGLAIADAEEVRDQCLEIVTRKLPAFDYDRRGGGFRNWLYTITNARIVDTMRKRRAGQLDTHEMVAIPDSAVDPAEAWESQWRTEHLAYCLEQAQWHVPTRSFRAFEMLLIDDRSVPEVCAELEMNANQVYKAKMTVLRTVRETLARVDRQQDHDERSLHRKPRQGTAHR